MARRRCRGCLQRSPPARGRQRLPAESRCLCDTFKTRGKTWWSFGICWTAFAEPPRSQTGSFRRRREATTAAACSPRRASRGRPRRAWEGRRHPHAVPPGTSEGGSLTCGVCGTPRRRTTSSQTFSAKPSIFPPEPNLGRPRFRDPQASGTTEDRKWMEGKPGEVTHTPA